MRVFCATLIGFALWAEAAAALSCMHPNVARSFNWHAEAAETYVVALGTLTISGTVPKQQSGKTRSVPANFDGVFLARKGAVTQRPVTIKSECASRWCGPIPDTTDPMLMFFKHTGDGLALHSGPCPGAFRANPTPQERAILTKCLRRGKCSTRQIKKLDRF